MPRHGNRVRSYRLRNLSGQSAVNLGGRDSLRIPDRPEPFPVDALASEVPEFVNEASTAMLQRGAT